jgi:hypothetical protein
MLALAVLFKQEEPAIHALIMTLPGNPRIFEVAYGFQDHIRFLVDAGHGQTAVDTILRTSPDDRCLYASMAAVDDADIVTWWA